MIAFEVRRTVGRDGGATRLRYDQAGRSFVVHSLHDSAVYALLVNDLELHVDNTDHVRYVDGYCPREAWGASNAVPPRASPGDVHIRTSTNLKPGEATRLTASPTAWPVSFNGTVGWLCVGLVEPPAGSAVSLNRDTILVIDGDQLVAVWLRVVPLAN